MPTKSVNAKTREKAIEKVRLSESKNVIYAVSAVKSKSGKSYTVTYKTRARKTNKKKTRKRRSDTDEITSGGMKIAHTAVVLAGTAGIINAVGNLRK